MAQWGLPASCQLQVLLINIFTTLVQTTPWGTHSFSVPIPSDRSFNDIVLSSQALCFDLFSQGGFVVSNGDQMQIGIGPAMSVDYSQGSFNATIGSLWPNSGAVTLFAGSSPRRRARRCGGCWGAGYRSTTNVQRERSASRGRAPRW